MKSPWKKPFQTPTEAVATYLGKNSSGLHLWQINGQVFTDSVSTVGGSPIIGKPYPALANQPDSRSHWVALVQPQGRFLPRPFGIPSGSPHWATWRQSLLREGRPSHAAFTSISSAGVMVADSYAGNFLTRIFGDKIYVVRSNSWYAANNAYRNVLAEYNEVKQLSTPVKTHNPGGNVGIVEVLVTDETVYLVEWQQGEKILSAGRRGYGWNGSNSVAWSRLKALNRETFAVRWVTAWRQDLLMRPGPSLAVMGDRLVCLCEVASQGRPKLATLSVLVETGVEPVLTTLQYENPQYEYLAGADEAHWTNAGSAAGPVVDPWGGSNWLYNSILTPGFNAWPTDNATGGTIWWQDNTRHEMPGAALFNTWLVWPDADNHIPCPRHGQQVAAFNAAGERQWVRQGWSDGSQRRIYTPVMGRGDHKLLVLVEEVETYSWTETLVSYTIEQFHPLGYWDPDTSYSVAAITGTAPKHCSVSKQRRIFWETWDARTGATITSMVASSSITGSFPHRNGGVELHNRAPGGDPYPGMSQQPVVYPSWGAASWSGTYWVGIFAPGQPIGSTSAIAYSCSILSASTYRPLNFDILNCCLSTDGKAVVFAPRWNNGSPIGRPNLWPTPNASSGTADPTGMDEEYYNPRIKVYTVAVDWSGNKIWENAIETNNPSEFTVGNPIAVGPNIVLHYRRNDVGYVRLINAATGVTVSEHIETGVNNSPAVSGDVYGELNQHSSGYSNNLPTIIEATYAGQDFLLTKLANNLVFFKP